MIELKACPICGSRVKIHKNIAHAGQYGIVCMTCPLEMLHFPTRVELIEAWNTRPNDAKWIRVDDELPGWNKMVLMYESGAYGGIRYGFWDIAGGFKQNSPNKTLQWELVENITHWMPLPTPPKQSREGE